MLYGQELRLEGLLPGEVVYWRTPEVKELFAYLLYRRNQTVGREQLAQLLWSGEDSARADANLHAAVHAVRRVLAEELHQAALLFHNDGYRLRLEPQEVRIDYDEWERELAHVPAIGEGTYHRHTAIFEAYKGDLFEQEAYAWAEAERLRLRGLWYDHGVQLAEFGLKHGQYDYAQQCCRSMIRREPLREGAYGGLMKSYVMFGDYVQAELTYQLLCERFVRELASRPSRSIADWYDQHVRGRKGAR